jgi:demethylmenaquinone methyltransferase/2-methoxy-6-polyprenyl-1,4-benzoquinol methylase
VNQINSETINAPSRQNVWQMFDRIAHRYDLLNHLLSFGQDIMWRKKLRRHLPEKRPLDVLDMATGTGDQLIALAQKDGLVGKGTGMDLAEKMLEVGREKIREMGMADRLTLTQGDAVDVPVEDNSYDLLTISFGIRNVLDVPRSLKNMYRALRPGGRVLILEFSLPQNSLIRNGYLFYFRHILPKLGGLISGDYYAYNYLNKTVETFPYGDAFCSLLQDAGFTNVRAVSLTFGVATIYRGDKLPENPVN